MKRTLALVVLLTLGTVYQMHSQEFKTVTVGSTVTFESDVIDDPDDDMIVSWQFKHNGVDIGPETDDPILTLENVQTEQSGYYSVGISSVSSDGHMLGPAFMSVLGWLRVVEWEFETGGYVTSSPSIGVDGAVYVGSIDKKIYALDGKIGTKKWEFVTGGVVSSSPAIGIDGTVYIGSSDQKIYALDGNTGVKQWEFTTGGSVVSSPAIGIDGTVYVGSTDYNVYALDGNTGAKQWEFTTEGKVLYSSPAIGADGTVYVGTEGQHDEVALEVENKFIWIRQPKVYALDGKTGVKQWEFETGHWVISSPAIGVDGTVYVGSMDYNIYALDGKTGAKQWEFVTGGVVTSSPAIGADGTVYVGSWDNKIYALNPDGTKQWEFITGHDVHSSPAIGADGTVYVGSKDTVVYALDGQTGDMLWGFPTGGEVRSSPAIGADGTVYVGSNDNKVYALGGSSELMESSWPMFGQNIKRTALGEEVEEQQLGPKITQQPKSQKIAEGSNVILSVEATGTGQLKYQWKKNGVSVPGAIWREDSTLVLENAQIQQAGNYTVQIKDSVGNVQSAVAKIEITEAVKPPNIITQPLNQNVPVGSYVALSVKAIGSSPLNYQWKKDGLIIPDATISTLVISSAKIADSGKYSVVVRNSSSEVESDTVELTISVIAPALITEISDQTVNLGDELILNLKLSGSSPMSVQWFKDDEILPSHKKPQLKINKTQLSDSGVYKAEISNSADKITSNEIEVKIIGISPIIKDLRVTGIKNVNVFKGEDAVIRVVLTQGTPPLEYKWFFNNEELKDKQGDRFTITQADVDDEGVYRVEVKNDYEPTAIMETEFKLTEGINLNPTSTRIRIGPNKRSKFTFEFHAHEKGLWVVESSLDLTIWNEKACIIVGYKSGTPQAEKLLQLAKENMRTRGWSTVLYSTANIGRWHEAIKDEMQFYRLKKL